MTSNSTECGVELPPLDGAVGEDIARGSTGGDFLDSDSARRGEFKGVALGEEAASASVAWEGGPDGARVFGDVDEPRVLKVENEGIACGDASGAENQVSSSVSGMIENAESRDSRNEKQEDKHVRTLMVDRSNILPDYNSFLSAFDEFAAKAKGEAVGHGYYIGDMVWGKVKSHPWWPGQIYNEALASPSVRRSKHEGQVLVAFFGDNSYGWFDPAELIPFEENFAEKSRQTTSRAFLNAVEEGVDEVSRRSSLGLACRCRNEFNFRPSGVEGYFVVDVGDQEPGVYGWNQIEKAHDSFQPREMFLFVEQLALQPLNHQFWEINFIKNKAAVLACRKARFEEFDETYAQAFGTASIRPPRPSVPAAVDPAKAPLSGRLVIAEALGQGRVSAKPAKTKDQLEKDKYLFKRRDEPMQMKSNRAIFAQASHSSNLPPVDGLSFSDEVMHFSPRDHVHQAPGFTVTYNEQQPKTNNASVTKDFKHSDSFLRRFEGGKKKTQVQKRPAGELTPQNAALVERKKKKKQKKEIKTETTGTFRQLPHPLSYSGTKVETAPGTTRHVPPDTKLENHKSDAVVGSFSSQSQQELDFGKLELRMMVTDLRALALNPFHGMKRSCPAVIGQVFLKYRSLVYQKSLALSPPTEREPGGGNSNKSLPGTVTVGPADKTNKKIVKPIVRLDDPTRGGKKRGPFDHLEDVKKKKLNAPDEIKKKKMVNDSGVTKKKTDNPRALAAERKNIQKPIVLQRVDTKENASKIAASAVPPKAMKRELGNRMESAAKTAAAQPRAVKLQSSSRTEHTARVRIPTMLVLRFPTDAALPSSAELRAKFARFGQMDHSATRIFWKTHTCRLVFLYAVDAEAALEFALGSSNLFGNSNVRCYIRKREAESEPEPFKIQKEDIPAPAPVNTTQLRDAATPPKSSLKKHLPPGDESGNGNRKGCQEKFSVGKDELVKGTVPTMNEKNRVSGVHQTQPLESSSSRRKMLASVAPQSNRAQNEPRVGPFDAPLLGARPVIDVSQQMVNLLVKCNDVVNNITSVLGFVPYQPL